MRFLVFILFSVILSNSIGQTSSKCEELYSAAESLFKSGENYSLAIKKISAYRLCANPNQYKKADDLLLKIYETVNKQKNDALKAQKEAEKQTKIAIEQRNIAQTNYLLSEAKSAAEKDPSLALRLLEAAIKITPDPAIEHLALKIYQESSFYKTLDTLVNLVILSPDKSKFLIAKDSILQLNDLNGTLLCSFKGHHDKITSAVFSPDGHTILSGSGDFTTCLWNLKGELLQTIKGHSKAVTAVAFSPDGKFILTGSADYTTRLWDLKGNQLKIFKGSKQPVYSIQISDGTKILTNYSINNRTYLWDFNQEGAEVTNYKTLPSNTDFSGNGKTIVSSKEYSVTWSDLEGNLMAEYIDSSDQIYRTVISPDEKLIFIWQKYIVNLLDSSGAIISKFNNDSEKIRFVDFSPDGKKVLICYEKHADLCYLNGEVIQKFISPDDFPFTNAYFTSDQQKIITFSKPGILKNWKVNLPEKVECPAMGSLAVSPKRNEILIGSWDRKARLFDFKGNLLQEFDGHTDAVTFIAFSPTGDTILTVSNDSTARLWNKNGIPIQVFKGHSGKILSAAFSPDGKKILTGSNDKKARLWNLNGDLIQEFRHSSFVTSVAFSPDNKWILLCGSLGASQLINSKDYSQKTFQTHTYYITSACFSPDSKKILTGSLDYSALLWDLNGDSLQHFPASNVVTSVAFSQNGKTILMCSGSKAILWDLKANELQQFSMNSSDPIVSGIYSPDGTRIIAGSTVDKYLRFWDIKTSFNDILKSGEIEPLTEAQKKKFHIE